MRREDAFIISINKIYIPMTMKLMYLIMRYSDIPKNIVS